MTHMCALDPLTLTSTCFPFFSLKSTMAACLTCVEEEEEALTGNCSIPAAPLPPPCCRRRLFSMALRCSCPWCPPRVARTAVAGDIFTVHPGEEAAADEEEEEKEVDSVLLAKRRRDSSTRLASWLSRVQLRASNTIWRWGRTRNWSVQYMALLFFMVYYY